MKFRLTATVLFGIVPFAWAHHISNTICEVRKDAQQTLVYLHGLDEEKPGSQELSNRKMLTALTEQAHFNLVMPRSNIMCKGQKLCWMHTDPKLHREIYDEILEETQKCVKKNVPIIFLGFSNGGYFATKIAAFCYTDSIAVIASGSAGSGADFVPRKNCPKLYITIGESDVTQPKTTKFVEELRTAKIDVDFRKFPGRHELSEKTLETILKK